MNTSDLLLTNLDRLLSSPASAETIRKLIFDLAIRGHLTIQSETDEPASVLIAKVIRTAQAEDKKFSAEPPVTEKPFELPSGWEWVRLGNTGKIFNGTSASAGEKVRLSKTSEGLPFIATKDVGYGRDPLCYENGLKVPHGDKDYKVAKPGAVLICAEGGSAGKKVGQTNQPICFGNKLYANETWAGIEPGYILSLYQSNFFYGEFKAKMAGIIGGIARSDFRSLRIPLPPLAEQKRIVAKVDELMALCDRLEAQLKERDVKQAALAKAALAKFTEDPSQENLQLLFHPSFSIEPEDLRKSVLSLAIQGKIEPQDPADETAHELIKRVTTEKSRLVQIGEIKKEETLDPITDNEVFQTPINWTWIRAGDLCRPISSGSTPDQKVFNTSHGVPYLKVYNIRNQAVDFEYKPQFIDVKYHEEKMKRSTLRPGDVIMNIVGPPLGKVAIIPNTFPEWNCNQAISFFRPIFPDFSPYIYVFLKEGSFLKNIQLIGTAGQDNISVTKCKFIPMPIPPLAEQRRIVAKVEQLMALVDALETQLDASRTTGEKLLEAMVAELTSA